MTAKSPRTCIICGVRASSGEHVFPAALGGRRENRGIYCASHNNYFSPLAGKLAEQLRAINALLGVVNDHTKESPAVRATDLATGREVSIGAASAAFSKPEILSQRETEDGTALEMAFSSEAQLDAWLATMKAKGVEFSGQVRSPAQRYFATEGHIRMHLGGPEGLRAIGYVALTFLAHRFPAIARMPELAAFKSYILGDSDTPRVWWEEPPETRENAFPFGHRVLLGLDAQQQTAFARVSLFSTLDFAVCFGAVPVSSSTTVIVEIDPLALHPPDDVRETRVDRVQEPTSPPDDPSAALAEDIRSGRGEARLGTLLQRISAHQLDKAAEQLLSRISGADLVDARDRAVMFSDAVDAEAQRIFNLARHIVRGIADVCSHVPEYAAAFQSLVESAPTNANGLTPTATVFIELVQQVIARQMETDALASILDRRRAAMLIGGGAGAHIIGSVARDIVMRT